MDEFRYRIENEKVNGEGQTTFKIKKFNQRNRILNDNLIFLI